MSSPAIVFAAAPVEPSAWLERRLGQVASPHIIAADAGAATAVALGYTPHVLVGDFDSLPTDVLDQLQAAGADIERYSRDKDFTDGDLAIRRALADAPSELLLVGFLGGPRLDQTLVNLHLLADLPAGTVMLDAWNECRLLRGPDSFVWQPESGEIISLVAHPQAASGITTSGLRWPLTNAELRPGETRGSSNEPLSASARVEVRSGTLALIRHQPPPGT